MLIVGWKRGLLFSSTPLVGPLLLKKTYPREPAGGVLITAGRSHAAALSRPLGFIRLISAQTVVGQDPLPPHDI
jgi:hypothetical protein